MRFSALFIRLSDLGMEAPRTAFRVWVQVNAGRREASAQLRLFFRWTIRAKSPGNNRACAQIVHILELHGKNFSGKRSLALREWGFLAKFPSEDASSAAHPLLNAAHSTHN